MSEEQGATVSAEAVAAEPQELETPTPEVEAEASPTTEGGGEPAEQAETQEHKKDAQERIRQEISRRKELETRLATLEARLQPPPDAPVRVDPQRFGEHLATLKDKAEDLRLEGRHAEALEAEIARAELIKEYRENNEKLAAWEKRQNEERQQKARMERESSDLMRAADIFREANNIPEKTWKEMGDWFAGQLEADPVLTFQFQEQAKIGHMAAIMFAHSKARAHFDGEAKKATEAKKQKDAAKSGQVGGGGGESKGVTSYQQLLNLGSKQLEAYRKNNPKDYQKLLNDHLK